MNTRLFGRGKYTKRPATIEAMRFEYTDAGLRALKEFAGEHLGTIVKHRHPGAKAEAELGTLEDGSYLTVKHIATEGDWIIKGVQGEFYAVKPGIFEETYIEAQPD